MTWLLVCGAQALHNVEHQQRSGSADKAWQRHFVRAMNHVTMKKVMAGGAMAGGDDDEDDGMSVAGQSDAAGSCISSVSRATATSKVRSEAAAARIAALQERAANGEKKFDSSSVAGDDVARMEKLGKIQEAAEDFLRENPEMRAIHSSASVRSMLQKQGDVAVGDVAGAGAAVAAR